MRLLIKGFSEQVLLEDLESSQRCLIVLNEETGEQGLVPVDDEAVTAVAQLAQASGQRAGPSAAPPGPRVQEGHEWEAPQLEVDVAVELDEDADRGESQL